MDLAQIWCEALSLMIVHSRVARHRGIPLSRTQFLCRRFFSMSTRTPSERHGEANHPGRAEPASPPRDTREGSSEHRSPTAPWASVSDARCVRHLAAQDCLPRARRVGFSPQREDHRDSEIRPPLSGARRDGRARPPPESVHPWSRPGLTMACRVSACRVGSGRRPVRRRHGGRVVSMGSPSRPPGRRPRAGFPGDGNPGRLSCGRRTRERLHPPAEPRQLLRRPRVRPGVASRFRRVLRHERPSPVDHCRGNRRARSPDRIVAAPAARDDPQRRILARRLGSDHPGLPPVFCSRCPIFRHPSPHWSTGAVSFRLHGLVVRLGRTDVHLLTNVGYAMVVLARPSAAWLWPGPAVSRTRLSTHGPRPSGRPRTYA